MDKERILVVEDDYQTSNYLKTYFDWLGYEVLITGQGSDVLDNCRLKIPSVVILDVALPDLNGFEVCRVLRNHNRTRQIPIIFLSQRSRRNDIIAAFELGADDYITKPFDIEELKLRVEGVIRRSRSEALIHPVTNLQAGELIIDKLKEIKDSAEPWTLLYITLKNLGAIKPEAADYANQTLAGFAEMLAEIVEKYGAPNDFLGQASENSFIVMTIPETAPFICQTAVERFNKIAGGSGRPVPKLWVGAVSSYDGPFTDIKQIATTLAEFRFKQQKLGCPDEGQGRPPRAEDIDYNRQLSEQVKLWQTAPELAQALMEVERLTATRVPDVKKIGPLFELAAKTLSLLQNRQRLCHLAAENLSLLPYKIRPYQTFEPAGLLETVEQAVAALEKFRLTIVPPADTGLALKVAVPEFKLRQLIYNVCRWLLFDEEKAALEIAVTANGAASLTFKRDDLKKDWPPDAPLLDALNQNRSGAVYGYLAQKIVTRYGGEMTLDGDLIGLSLPLAEPNQAQTGPKSPPQQTADENQSAGAEEASSPKQTAGKKSEAAAGPSLSGPPKVDAAALRQMIKEQRLFLETQKRLTFPPHILEKATDLIDPLAEDLLAKIELMLAALSSTPGMAGAAHPWPAIERNYRFFRLITLDLRKHRPLIPAPVNLISLLESIKPMVAHRTFDHQIVIESEIKKPVINTDKMRLSQIFVNLALNALEAMPEGGRLKFRIKWPGRNYAIEVIDGGPGIPLEDQSRLFDPHFTTKGEGRGAGLYHVKTYVKQLNGQIKLFSRLGEGATFVVTLPPNWEAGYF